MCRFVGKFMTQVNTFSPLAVLHHSFKDKMSSDEKLKSFGYPMAHIALNLWKLPPPKLLISVTGGAQDFDLSKRDKLSQVQAGF